MCHPKRRKLTARGPILGRVEKPSLKMASWLLHCHGLFTYEAFGCVCASNRPIHDIETRDVSAEPHHRCLYGRRPEPGHPLRDSVEFTCLLGRKCCDVDGPASQRPGRIPFFGNPTLTILWLFCHDPSWPRPSDRAVHEVRGLLHAFQGSEQLELMLLSRRLRNALLRAVKLRYLCLALIILLCTLTPAILQRYRDT
jgi:hypothetical protein